MVGFAYIRVQPIGSDQGVYFLGRIDNIIIRQAGGSSFLSFQVEDVPPSDLQDTSELWNCEYCYTERLMGDNCPQCGANRPLESRIDRMYFQPQKHYFVDGGSSLRPMSKYDRGVWSSK